MKLSSLPPAYRAVPVTRLRAGNHRPPIERYFAGRDITLYASGTAALACAISECVRRSSTRSPEIILPAYGCPDLVAACVFASANPRLVDISPTHWSYDANALEAHLSPNTVAVVAVNLLGLGDDATSLSSLCRERGILLIQDSAQCLPRASREWPGDYVVLSFGRGKPLNLLHGGALIHPPDRPPRLTPSDAYYTCREKMLSSRVAALLFNIATRPHIYWATAALPLTRIGQTTFRPLGDVHELPPEARSRMGAAFEEYCRVPSYISQLWEPYLDDWNQFGIKRLGSPDPAGDELLRLPLLAPNRQSRDALVSLLNHRGLGASRLYGSALTEVAGIPDEVKRQGLFRNAANLADRLFTLPTHRMVTDSTLASTTQTIAEWRGQCC